MGVESTIVDCCVDPVQVLRPGAITREQIAALLGQVTSASGPSRAAGMLDSHYAPECAIELFESLTEAVERRRALNMSGRRVDLFDASTDPVVVATQLYETLRSADRSGLDTLVVALPSPEGIGWAIRDRLGKAAAPRPGRHHPH